MFRLFFVVVLAALVMVFGFSLAGAQTKGPNLALSFDGECDYVEVPSALSLNAFTAVTLEAWIRLAGESNSGDGIVGKSGDVPSPVYGLFFDEDGASVRFQVYTVERGVLSPSPTRRLELGTWHHIAGVYDGAGTDTFTPATSIVYVNGQVESGMGCSSPDPKACQTHLWKSEGSVLIGKTVFPTPDCPSSQPKPGSVPQKISGYFHGLLDEVRIWNVARTQAQIQAFLYQRLPLTERVGLMGYWTMDQLNRKALMDRSGNDNYGQLVGDTKFVSTFPLPSPAPASSRSPIATTWGALKKR